MNIIVSGGGTGGHIYPALTIIRAIERHVPSARILYVGTPNGLEADIVPREGIDFAAIELAGFERRLSFENVLRAGRALRALVRARGIVHDFRPDVAVGTGGYVAGPVLLAASLAGVPTLVQEQNVFAGVTNRILSHFATAIAVGMEDARGVFPKEKTFVTGNPIRPEVLTVTRAEGAAFFGFDPTKKTVLISGGSRGARSINRAMVEVLAHAAARQDVQYIHVTGADEHADTLARLRARGVRLEDALHIRVLPYLYNMPQAMAAADIAVFRAGATGLAELAARGVPAILIPYPYAAENHQEKNARALAAAGAAEVILNRDIGAAALEGALHALLADDARRTEMAAAMKRLGKPEAAEEIAALALRICKKEG
ncbi:undecaprenyldiphospho-muramoylpentapeptide beta-N-acetylglucosaminyltransferase [Selenomonas sp. F0473]|uniref:undecaprenyldiphospho-muramoylpentapeptide beta-N-acetylglucosaminyltransferase n=1 Tax=Selenomonas sp. F0473 TaxID=999423 RepID=UPI00029E6D78|nr:undecaprenyldiphospho-muramoylpentapeptide beta-N-acetylglucosaminyltransferase [Selenomonas sp. F0473]EKU71986.1 undecaprenyldiphospho-muramoylpentapeptide beta-N-acetylglucosaminyltransferase [Selenomonas sp. F0473]